MQVYIMVYLNMYIHIMYKKHNVFYIPKILKKISSPPSLSLAVMDSFERKDNIT